MQESNAISTRWAAALEASATIASLCTARFGKEHFVRKGRRKGHELGEDDAPFLVVLPFVDEGGFEAELATAKVVVTIGIVDSEMEPIGQRGDSARIFDSMDQVEQAVLKVLESTDDLPSRWTGEYEVIDPGFCVRHILYEIDTPRTIGAD